MPSTSLISRLFSTAAVPWLAAVLLVLLPVASSQAAEEKPPPSPLAELHQKVERAFVRCDAALLRPVLSRRIKTFVASRALAPSDGYYGADQLLLLFERLFEGRTTVQFTALSADPKPRRDGRASLPIRWISSGSGQSRSEISLALILAKEGTDWQIREIRDQK
jgi:hypothetical protein